MNTDALLKLATRRELFDFSYYAKQAGVDFSTPAEAFVHFDQTGWKENLNPSAKFDTKYYLARNPDVSSAKINPLEHYLKNGCKEGRNPRVANGSLSIKPKAPEPNQWVECSKFRRPWSDLDTSDAVDVVIPVYRGYDDTLACIFSVINSHNSTPYRLIVIDDRSPDAELSASLDHLADLNLIELIRNEQNLGFVRSVNIGMRLSTNRDVVLLNSDTVVYNNWLDRLRYHAKASPNVGTVTPFSNNATILSYPQFLENNNYDLEIDYSKLDDLFSSINKKLSSSIITGVGFCFYINRACLMEIGYFDAELFGRGYGEENDFCRRADKAGWDNLAAWDVFVRHTGEISFSESATESKRIGYKALLSVHPEYDKEVWDFIKNDSLKPARERVDIERAKRISRDHGVLFIEHGRGGGTSKHIQDLAAMLNKSGLAVYHARPDGLGNIAFSGLSDFDLPNLPCIPTAESDKLINFINTIGVQFVHVHSFIDFELASVSHLCAQLHSQGLRYYYTAHDYVSLCPKITMTDWSGTYCNSNSSSYCNVCLRESGGYDGIDIDSWRSTYVDILRFAYRVIVPHADVETRLKKYIPGLSNIVVRNHFASDKEIDHPVALANTNRNETDTFCKVGIVGAIGPHKGSGLLLRMAADAFVRNLPLQLKLYGYSDRAEFEQFPNVEITGKYMDDEIDEMISKDPPDVIFLPSLWPETHCYALDTAFRNGIMPAVFDIGAQASRVREVGLGQVIPLNYSLIPSKINDLLISYDSSLSKICHSPYIGSWTSVKIYYDDETIMVAN